MSKFKIRRLYSDKENERIAQFRAPGSLNLKFDAIRSKSDEDIKGVNESYSTANDPTEGVTGYNYIPGRGSFGLGGDYLGSEGSGQPAEMDLDPALMASMSPQELQKYYYEKVKGFAQQSSQNALDEIVPKLQTLHNQFMTSTPTGRQNFFEEAKTIIRLMGDTLTPQNKYYIKSNFPGFANLV